MDKKHLHHLWRRLRWIHPIYFLILAIVCGVICVYSLRANNEHMVKLKDAVYAADKNNTDVEGALKALQAYVTTHMNTSLKTPDGVYPPIQLKYTYDRLVQAESDSIAKANSQIYTDAQAYCEGLNHVDFSGHNRVPCIEQYVQTHTNTAAQIPDSLYKFDFVSPKWSPDKAGWMMLISGVSALLFIVTWIARHWLKKASA